MRSSTNFSAPLQIFVITVIATQWSVVRAQDNNGYPYYYWLSPGRIVGLAIGAVALVGLILTFIIFACRRRRRASRGITVSNYMGMGGRPQVYPSWRDTQQPVQTQHGPDPASLGWYYPSGGEAKGAASSAHRTPPSEYSQSSVPLGEARRTPSVDQVQRPPPTSPVQRPPPVSQVQRAAISSQVQRIAPSSQEHSAVPSVQGEYSTFSGQAQRPAPAARVQSTPPPARTQEQGAPPRHVNTQGTSSSSAANGRDPSPPPYSPMSQPRHLKPAGPSNLPGAQTAR